MLSYDGIKPKYALTVEAMCDISNSDIVFYLTGSRFFRTAKINSDWDFYCQDNIAARAYLTARGFRELRIDEMRIEQLYPGDPNIALVLTKGDVQVQLVKNVAWKQAAQDLLNSLPRSATFFGAKGCDARPWWNWAFKRTEGRYRQA